MILLIQINNLKNLKFWDEPSRQKPTSEKNEDDASTQARYPPLIHAASYKGLRFSNSDLRGMLQSAMRH